MKSSVRLFLAAAAALFLLSAASLASSAKVPADAPAADALAADASAALSGYVLKSSGDEIRVYSDAACTQQMYVLDVRACDLPQEDRELLECGVLVESEQQLLSLLEDYTG